jgi:hypothetical protein
MMIVLLLFLQKQNLALDVYLFGSVLSFKVDFGFRACPRIRSVVDLVDNPPPEFAEDVLYFK